jgi:hypothetical protein
LFAYDSTSTLYPIFNEKGFKLYTIGSNIYCPENQKDLVLAYYNNLSNYDTQNCRYGYGKYLADKVAVDGKKKFDYIYKNVTIDQGIFEKLYHISDRQEPEAIKIPEKYINIRNAEKPGASIFGYDDRQLYAYSKDRVMSKDIELDLIDGQVYYVIESGNGYIKGYRLVHEINENLKETIFRDR